MKVPSLDPRVLLESSAHRLVIKAILTPVGGLDRFQPAGFPEIGHVIYKAPRGSSAPEKVCIVDSSPSMANHLETVCLLAPQDPTLVPALDGLPHMRCVTGEGPDRTELVVTSFTEGHRLASTYFLEGRRLLNGKPHEQPFSDELRAHFGFRDLGKKSHPLPADWWSVYKTIFHHDPNSLVHGILFPQWQIKIARVLTAVHEAFGAERVGTSGVKFDKIGKTTSGQPIFAKDEETAETIRATFVLDLGLVRSFGRANAEGVHGLDESQKTLLIALSLWKIGSLLRAPFRYRSGCDLECGGVEVGTATGEAAAVSVDALLPDIQRHIKEASFERGTTDVFWPMATLFKEAVASGTEDPDDRTESDSNEG